MEENYEARFEEGKERANEAFERLTAEINDLPTISPMKKPEPTDVDYETQMEAYEAYEKEVDAVDKKYDLLEYEQGQAYDARRFVRLELSQEFKEAVELIENNNLRAKDDLQRPYTLKLEGHKDQAEIGGNLVVKATNDKVTVLQRDKGGALEYVAVRTQKLLKAIQNDPALQDKEAEAKVELNDKFSMKKDKDGMGAFSCEGLLGKRKRQTPEKSIGRNN